MSASRSDPGGKQLFLPRKFFRKKLNPMDMRSPGACACGGVAQANISITHILMSIRRHKHAQMCVYTRTYTTIAKLFSLRNLQSRTAPRQVIGLDKVTVPKTP